MLTLPNPFNSSLVDLPLPHTDSISCLAEAVGIAGLTVPRPRRAHTVVITTDEYRRGLGIARLAPLTTSSAHHVVAESCAHPSARGAIVVACRTAAVIQHHDLQLLHHLRSVLHHAGIELLDFVCAGRGGLYCPRTLVDQLDPWLASTPTG